CRRCWRSSISSSMRAMRQPPVRTGSGRSCARTPFVLAAFLPASLRPNRKFTDWSRSWRFRPRACAPDWTGRERRCSYSIKIVDELSSEPSLKNYHLLPSVRGDLLARLGRFDEARAEFERAAALTRNARERTLLLERAAASQSGRELVNSYPMSTRTS